MKNILMFIGLMILFGFIYHIDYQQIQRYHQDFKRGDAVQIIGCQAETCWYQQCKKVTYLAGQALDRDNAVWLLVEECPWAQYPDIGRVTTMAVVTMRKREIELK